MNPGGTPSPIIYSEQDVLGINPDNFNEQGFSIQEMLPNVYYKCTTYLWAIHKMNSLGEAQDQIFYVIPCYNKVPEAYDNNPTYIIKNLLVWRYLII